MRITLIYFCAGIVLFTSGCGCSKEPINTEETTTSNGQNLILNPSFESNGQPYYEFWYYPGGLSPIQDTSYYSQDVPPRGGNWSLKLEVWWSIDHTVETYVTGQQGTNIYQLTVWMKFVQYLLPAGEGLMYLGIKSNNVTTITKSIEDTLTQWTEYTIIDTLTTIRTDTIVVGLSSGGAPLPTHHVLFDSVKLIKIDP